MTPNKYDWLKNTALFHPSGLKHIFEGTLRAGVADGYHYEGFPENYSGQIIPRTDYPLDRHGGYKARVMVNGVVKRSNGGFSTFFPKHWSPQEVIDTINEAYYTREFKGRNMYIGEIQSGMKICMYLDGAGKIVSAFPIYEGPPGGITTLGWPTDSLMLFRQKEEISMKYPYHIEYDKFRLPIVRLPEEIELVTLFLLSDVDGPLPGKNFYLDEIDRVLQGEIPISEIGGNAFALRIRPEFTTVIYLLPEDAADGGTQECFIETEELRHLIAVWLDLQLCLYYERQWQEIRKAQQAEGFSDALAVSYMQQLQKIMEGRADARPSDAVAQQQQEIVEERHTDPAISVSVLPIPSAKRYAPAERKEEMMAVPS